MKSPIFNAKDLNLDQRAGMVPQLQGAFSNWAQPMTFILVQKAISGGFLVESGDAGEPWTSPSGETIQGKQVTCSGIAVPKTRRLDLKAYGQRAWKGMDVLATPELILKFDDCIVWKDTQYRVLIDNPEMITYGYVYYFVGEDFKFSGPLTQVTTGQDEPDGDQNGIKSGDQQVIM